MSNSQKNFINTNEVYPILDIINRHRQQVEHAGIFSNGSGGSGDTVFINDAASWQIESFHVERDVDNPIDPNVIKKIHIVYRNGAVEDITLIRGLNPPVDESVPDSEYINNLMLTEVFIERFYEGRVQYITARINRENGYGPFESVELDYHEHDHLSPYEGGWDD